MDVSLLPRVLSTACLDGSLALIAGLLLAWRWLCLANPAETKVEGRRMFKAALAGTATLLLFACCAQFYLLTADFSGQTSWRGCLQQMPDMLLTHAGRLDAQVAVVAFVLLVITFLPLRRGLRASCVAFFLCVIVVLRSATGHAAMDGLFSVAELLQCVHLASTAVWSGAILVSGFYVLPELARRSGPLSPQDHDPEETSRAGSVRFHSYLSRLSGVSTVAVSLVLLTGVLKSYRVAGVSVSLLRSATWGDVLLLKVVCVCLAVALGGVNRLQLQRSTGWTPEAVRRTVRVLRLEAVCMLLILGLSALLGNLGPPSAP